MKYMILIMAAGLLCCSKPFDKPGEYPDPAITADMTIAQLKSLHTRKGNFDLIAEERVISGIVVADDRSGNYYNSIVIQDTTGGITLLMERAALYNDYPAGRRIYIKIKGLMLGDYRGNLQLGAGIDMTDPADLILSGIASPLLSRYVIKGSLRNEVTPVVVTAAQLTTSLQDRYMNTLIRLDSMELPLADSNATYANTSSKLAASYQLGNCSGMAIALRTSAYASFAGSRMPSGNGSVTGIYTLYNSDKQLLIRDTTDMQLTAKRCGSNTTAITDTAFTAGISLAGTSPLLLDCNSIDSLLPAGISVHTGVTATANGAEAAFSVLKASWAATTGGVKNYASATGLTAASTQAQQQAAVNRAIGVRQVAATDKGIAFVIEANNTVNCRNISVKFLLQSLDAAAGRGTQWIVDYAQGSSPVRFIPLTTAPETLHTGNSSFGSTVVSVNLPADVENSTKKLTIRIAALDATTGSGNRASTAVDDIAISWK